MILRARWVLPISQPPIEDGGVSIEGERILAVGPIRSVRPGVGGEVVDLGEVIVLPGFVNAHCHLDYTLMAGQVAPPKTFADWIKAMLALKAGWSYTDYAQSWLVGAQMLLRYGVTTVGDIEAVPELLPEILASTSLRVVSFLEMTGVRSQRSPVAIVAEAVQQAEVLRAAGRYCGLSPHAPYSTSPELLDQCAAVARQKRFGLAMHVAESAEEFEMFTRRSGAMYDWLKSQRDMSDCGGVTPVEHLARHQLLGDQMIAVHANYLTPSDRDRLGQTGTHVCHCPRSRGYFRHAPFPYDELVKAGVKVSLGTDSLVSVISSGRKKPELNFFEELQTFAQEFPHVPSERIVEAATVHGAMALGMGESIGELREGYDADLIVVPYVGSNNRIYDAVVHHRGPVAGAMIRGAWVMAPSVLN